MLRNPRLLRGRRERPHRRRAAKQIDIGDLHDRIGKAGPTFRSSPGAHDRSRPGGDGQLAPSDRSRGTVERKLGDVPDALRSGSIKRLGKRRCVPILFRLTTPGRYGTGRDLFWVGLLCVPFAWLVWYFAPSLR